MKFLLLWFGSPFISNFSKLLFVAALESLLRIAVIFFILLAGDNGEFFFDLRDFLCFRVRLDLLLRESDEELDDELDEEPDEE